MKISENSLPKGNINKNKRQWLPQDAYKTRDFSGKKRSELKVEYNGIRTHLILNGVDISSCVTGYKIEQKAGDIVRVQLELIPKEILEVDLKEIANVEVINEDNKE